MFTDTHEKFQPNQSSPQKHALERKHCLTDNVSKAQHQQVDALVF